MSFYGITRKFISSYLWCTILWNVGSGYDGFDRKEEIICIFHWGFPGRNRRIFFRFLVRHIRSIKMEVEEGICPRHVLSIEIRSQGSTSLTRTDENFTLGEIEQKAAELAYFLHVPIEVFQSKILVNTTDLSSEQLRIRSKHVGVRSYFRSLLFPVYGLGCSPRYTKPSFH
ncbi:hypothetical protein AMTRI_Chr06g197330 [Amborella trichopoda]